MTDFDFALPALPGRVWQALTDPAKLAAWFMDNDLRPEPGYRFTLRPQGLAGFNGPVHAQVLQVEPSREIVMVWRYAGTRAVVTWLVEPARGGSRLRVSHAGQLGPPTAQAILNDTYERLYGQRLRAVLSVGMLSNVTPAGPVQAPRARERGPGRRRGQLATRVAGSVALLIGLGAATWLLAPDPNSSTAPSYNPSGPPGSGVLGSASPTRRPTASASASGPAASSSALAVGGPRTTVDGRPQPSVPGSSPGPVALIFQKTPRGLLEIVVQVSLTNSGPGTAAWHNVAVRLSGVNLSVASSTASVVYTAKPPLHCFAPTGTFAELPVGTPVTFSFTVSGSVLGDLQSVQLDQSGCA